MVALDMHSCIYKSIDNRSGGGGRFEKNLVGVCGQGCFCAVPTELRHQPFTTTCSVCRVDARESPISSEQVPFQ